MGNMLGIIPPPLNTQELLSVSAVRFSWQVAIAGQSRWIGRPEQQSLLESRDVAERLLLLCELYHKSWETRWSRAASFWFSVLVRRWSPVVGMLILAWTASNFNFSAN